MLDEMKKLDFKHWEDLRSTLGVSQTTLDRIKQVLHEHLKQEKEKEKAGSEADGWLAASSSSSAANPTQPEISAEGSKKVQKLSSCTEYMEFVGWLPFATCSPRCTGCFTSS
jgi:(p)ppGpp synthase/HD superfamily hydrolase